ncbi:hypothetical protein FSP39_007693 [Pinctada imbricata]|uniref:Ionotropic glutamate receptor C-terminal domain-containing protein n=1 Tax=Pinctada imbricata TaxID=66713 RepID=A0AA88XPP0_PINIB|nr:hypothetical protein FSP39_007693 [Pinctada imbricata]
MYPDSVIQLRPGVYGMGHAIARLTEQSAYDSMYVLVGEEYLQDGFLDGLSHEEAAINISIVHIIITKDDLQDSITLYQKLQEVKEYGSKVIITHLEQSAAIHVMGVSKRLGYFDKGFVWVLSELSKPDNVENVPTGLISLEVSEEDGLESILQRTLYSVISTLADLNSQRRGSAGTDFRDSFYMYIGSVPYSPENKGLSFDSHSYIPVRANVTYKILNLGGENKEWIDVGLIGDEIKDLSVIQWPGNTIFGPIKASRKFFRIVTRPVTPFVFAKGPIWPSDSCYGDKICLKILDGNPLYINSPYRDQKPYNLYNVSYELYCCSGIVVDIIESLSKDLDFDFQMYFTDNQSNSSDPYHDLIESVETGQSHILAGAVTITSMRAHNIRFTEPFYFSGFSMIVPVSKSKTSIIAFLAPFDIEVWLMIFASATVVAIATSLFEWNSPFGLNPWGRKRSKNYTLGSALVMVYSVLFGHTVSTKSPKSWPSKVLQNFWAALAIVTVASYTANLAAYLAGNSEVEDIDNIYQIGNRRVYAKQSSAAVDYIKVLNKISNKKIMVHEISPDDSITSIRDKIRDSTFDVYIEDRPIIEYMLSQYDNCTIKITGSDFGENLYAFGLSKDAMQLREEFSSLILQYVEGGFIQNIRERYIRRRECEGLKEIYNQKYSLEHTGGLFLALIGAMVLSICLLGVEHIVFKYLVPYARKKSPGSIFKNRNIEFINQRLYRIINSEELISPKEAAREMMRFIKDRQFVRVFQKNEIKEASRHQREAMKGVRFYSLYNKLMRSYRTQFSMTDSVFTTDSSANLYSISEDESDEADNERSKTVDADRIKESIDHEDDEFKLQTSFRVSSPPRRSKTFSYPKNNTRHKRFSFQGRKKKHSDEVTVNPLWIKDKLPLASFTEEDEKASTSSACQVLTVPIAQTKSYGSLQKRNGTWPSMDLSSYDTLQEKHEASRGRCSSERENLEMQDIRRRQLEESCESPRHRQLASTDRNSNYYGRSLKMKDNRVKSTIRRHALAKFRRHSSSIFDECAVEALSKEDLLILWKKSEIDLQTRLNRVSLQNVQLKKLLRIAEDTGHVIKNESEDAKDDDDEDVFQVSRL